MSDYTQLIEELCIDEDWHMKELSIYKSIPHRYGTVKFGTINDSYWKMCVPMIYAHWEGFCVQSLKKVCDYISAQHIQYSSVIDDIAVLAMSKHIHSLSGQKIEKDKAIIFYRNFLEKHSGSVEIDTAVAVSAHSKLNYKRLKNMMGQIGIEIDSNEVIKSKKNTIEKLVTYRNKICHGENSIKVTEDDIVSFIRGINALFDALLVIFESYLQGNEFLIKE